MEYNSAIEIFDKLYEDVNGHSISIQGRDNHQYESKSFVYGEIMSESFYDILSHIHPNPSQIFYDFGSGTGKAVMLGHLLFGFTKSKGIEFVDSLYDTSIHIMNRYEQEIRPLQADNPISGSIEFTLGSVLDFNTDDADIVFMNSTCFQEDLMDAIDEKLKTLKPGSHIITLSKSLKSPEYNQDSHQRYDFSWGEATVFFHTKL